MLAAKSLQLCQNCATPWTVARQARLPMGFPGAIMLGWVATPGDLPDRGVEPTSLTSPASAGGPFNTSPTFFLPHNFLQDLDSHSFPPCPQLHDSLLLRDQARPTPTLASVPLS